MIGKTLQIFSFVLSIIAIYWYFFLEDNNLTTFVAVEDNVTRAYFEVACSRDYDEESYLDCKPKKCGRVVQDFVVSLEEALHLRRLAEKGIALAGSDGGASILDLHSGALSKGSKFINVYSFIEANNLDIFKEEDFSTYKKVKDKIKEAIATEFNIPAEKLFLTKPTFFSRMNTKPAKTLHDEYWHPHVDKITYGSFHYTSLLYLSNFSQEFKGGRFIFVDSQTNRTVEPRIGRVSFFTSGSENLHYVEKLESGVRYAITISFTCDPGQAISEPFRRVH